MEVLAGDYMIPLRWMSWSVVQLLGGEKFGKLYCCVEIPLEPG